MERNIDLTEIETAVADAARNVPAPAAMPAALSHGEQLMAEVAKSVDALHDHMLAQINSLRHILEVVEEAIKCKRKSHEDQLREYASFADKAMTAINEVGKEVHNMGTAILQMPEAKNGGGQ